MNFVTGCTVALGTPKTPCSTRWMRSKVEAGARSFPELSLSPFFERSWASLYEALEDGKINAERLRQVFVQFAPLPPASQVVFVGVDTSNLYRPEADAAADRTLFPIPHLPKTAHPSAPAAGSTA